MYQENNLYPDIKTMVSLIFGNLRGDVGYQCVVHFMPPMWTTEAGLRCVREWFKPSIIALELQEAQMLLVQVYQQLNLKSWIPMYTAVFFSETGHAIPGNNSSFRNSPEEWLTGLVWVICPIKANIVASEVRFLN
jgi:hypothetical protein